MDSLKICLLLILFFKQNNPVVGYKLVYQRDLSEYCRRRVAPSIFLGRQVVEANSRVLQLSRLDLPYSCYISVRTESGSNIVMVIMELALNELQKSCGVNGDQLLVYEMGETFGGYWGPMPDLVNLRGQDTQEPKLYTLKTTQPSTTTTEPSTTTEEETTDTTTESPTPELSKPQGDYIEVELPLLNVSINFEPSNVSGNSAEDLDAIFEYKYDVTPIRGVQYETSMLPLVQFRMRPVTAPAFPGRADARKNEPQIYDLDIIQEFTPDLRLTFAQFNPTSKRRKSKQRYQPTRRLNFRKHKTLWESKVSNHSKRKFQGVTRRTNDLTKYKFPTTKVKIKDNASKSHTESTEDTWLVVKDLIKKLAKTNASEKEVKMKHTVEDTELLMKIADMNHNKSVYLSPNLNIYSSDHELNITNNVSSTKDPTRKTTVNPRINNDIDTIQSVTEIPSSVIENDLSWSLQLNETTETAEAKETEEEQTYLISAITMSSIDTIRTNQYELENTTGPSTVTESVSNNFDSPSSVNNVTEREQPVYNTTEYEDKNSRRLVTGSMVGHESWENLVQAAPEMAELLNQSVPYDVQNTSVDIKQDLNETSLSKRKKKEIHSIPIEEARPHYLSTKTVEVTTTSSAFHISDLQEFAELVELQDDEVHGRVALRFLRKYVGAPLFNLCNFSTTTTTTTRRHVHLFNSSRIVLAINNFTLERMVIIMTAVKTLMAGEIRCPQTQLECQVAGARVCLDDLAACDGIPSCGSYDIYDEDRRLCNVSTGFPHNVYLAAFTFLSVLLTLMYAVHYWLNRCVPKVADAFFIYTNGIENVLYLDSIMRSPNDVDDFSKMIYHANMYGDINYDDTADIAKPAKSIFWQCLEALCFCFKNKKKTDALAFADARMSGTMQRHIYSFQEFEISKMFKQSKDTAVQTGDSLELNFSQKRDDKLKSKLAHRIDSLANEYPLMIQDSLLTLEEPLPEEHKDELSLMKFFNSARVESSSQISTKVLLDDKLSEDIMVNADTKEIEMRSIALDSSGSPQPGTSRIRSNTKIADAPNAPKHLRFEEVTTIIPSNYTDEESDLPQRRSVILRPGKSGRGNPSQLDTIHEGDENKGSREPRHFWGTSKVKKQKLKGQVSLR